jgi:hypothetical protein
MNTNLHTVDPTSESNEGASKYCPSCGSPSETWAHICPSSGHDYDVFGPPSENHLWNPMAAAWWSLLLTPLFAAILLDHNWRSLGNREKSFWSRVLILTAGGALAAGLISAIIPTSAATDKVITGLGKIVGITLTASCFSIARAQRQFLSEAGRSKYEKRRWGRPIAMGGISLAAYIGLIFAIAIFTPADASIVESETCRVMTEFFKDEPQRGITGVSSVNIHHLHGHDYAGTAEFLLNNQRVPVDLSVHLENGKLQWSAQPHDQQPMSLPSN